MEGSECTFFLYGDLDGGVGEKRLAERKEEEDRGSGSDKWTSVLLPPFQIIRRFFIFRFVAFTKL